MTKGRQQNTTLSCHVNSLVISQVLVEREQPTENDDIEASNEPSKIFQRNLGLMTRPLLPSHDAVLGPRGTFSVFSPIIDPGTANITCLIFVRGITAK